MSDTIKLLERKLETNFEDRETRAKLYRERERLGLPKWTLDEARANQLKVCAIYNYPHFAPYTGVCWNCKHELYVEGNQGDGTSFVTGCRRCARSYCD